MRTRHLSAMLGTAIVSIAIGGCSNSGGQNGSTGGTPNPPGGAGGRTVAGLGGAAGSGSSASGGTAGAVVTSRTMLRDGVFHAPRGE